MKQNEITYTMFHSKRKETVHVLGPRLNSPEFEKLVDELSKSKLSKESANDLRIIIAWLNIHDMLYFDYIDFEIHWDHKEFLDFYSDQKKWTKVKNKKLMGDFLFKFSEHITKNHTMIDPTTYKLNDGKDSLVSALLFKVATFEPTNPEMSFLDQLQKFKMIHIFTDEEFFARHDRKAALTQEAIARGVDPNLAAILADATLSARQKQDLIFLSKLPLHKVSQEQIEAVVCQIMSQFSTSQILSISDDKKVKGVLSHVLNILREETE